MAKRKEHETRREYWAPLFWTIVAILIVVAMVWANGQNNNNDNGNGICSSDGSYVSTFC